MAHTPLLGRSGASRTLFALGLAAAAVASAALSGGCSLFVRTSLAPARYFAPQVPEGRRVAPKPVFPEPLETRVFTAPKRLGTRFETVDPQTGEVTFSDFHYWADDPEELVSAALNSHLEASGLFPAVYRRAAGHRPRFALAGRVLAFQQRKAAAEEGEGRVVVEVELALVDTETSETLWAGTPKVERPVSGEAPEGVAAAMAEAIHQIARELTSALAKIKPPAPNP